MKTKLDRANYILLGIANIFTAIIIMIIGAIALYYWCIGMSDSNGGGWLLMIIMMLGIMIVPWLFMILVQMGMYIVGLVQYRRNRVKLSRIFGLISSIASFVASMMCVLVSITILSVEFEVMIVAVGITFICASYSIMTIVFSCVNISK